MKPHFSPDFIRKANSFLSPKRIHALLTYLADNPYAGEKVDGLPSLYELKWDGYKVIYHYIVVYEFIHFLDIVKGDEEILTSEKQRKETVGILRSIYKTALKVFGIIKIKELLAEHWDDISEILDLLSED